MRQKVLDRKDKIDVWYEARAIHLIQDPVSKVIKGAQIEKLGPKINVLARKGVILTTGGFENNKEMIQNYLAAPKLAPLGTIYNKDDGISMAQEVGAKMWHMDNYESLGLLRGLSFDTPEGERSKLILGWPSLNHGSVFMVVDDGKRYFNEAGPNRHGHIFDHGIWRVPRTHEKPYIIFDQKQYEKIGSEPIPHLYGAGELGGFNANQYQGGGNLAECLIFGKIVGEQAAKVTDEVKDKASDKYNGINELVDGDKVKNIKLGKDQYLGESNAGIGGKLVVRVTYDDNKIKNVEVVQNHESEDVGKKL